MEEKLSFPENVVYREEPEGGILFNVDTGEMRVVQDVAWGICHMIDRGSYRSRILHELRERYPEVDGLEEDMDSFLLELCEAGMIQQHD